MLAKDKLRVEFESRDALAKLAVFLAPIATGYLLTVGRLRNSSAMY